MKIEVSKNNYGRGQKKRRRKMGIGVTIRFLKKLSSKISTPLASFQNFAGNSSVIPPV